MNSLSHLLIGVVMPEVCFRFFAAFFPKQTRWKGVRSIRSLRILAGWSTERVSLIIFLVLCTYDDIYQDYMADRWGSVALFVYFVSDTRGSQTKYPVTLCRRPWLRSSGMLWWIGLLYPQLRPSCFGGVALYPRIHQSGLHTFPNEPIYGHLFEST